MRHEDDRPLARLPRLSSCLVSSLSTAHLRDLPLQAQVRHQRLCMVEQVLAAHPRPAVRVGVVAPAEYARVGQVVREQVAQPVDAVDTVNAAACRPRLLAVPVQAVDRDDARLVSAAGRRRSWRGSALNDWVGAFTHYLYALQNCTGCLCWQRDRRRCYCRGCGVFHRSLPVRYLCRVPLRRASSTRTGRVVPWCQP